MTTHTNRPATFEETPLELLIQRCADGELSDTDERALLAKLDFQPEQWRRLALSFIEQRVLGAASRECAAAARSLPLPTVARVAAGSRRFSWTQLASLSMAVVAAFALGRGWPTEATGTTGDAVSAVRPVPADSAAANPPALAEVAPPATDEGTPGPQRDHAPSPSQPALFVNWVLPGSEQPVQVPVLPAEAAEDWRPFAQPALSRQTAESLRRAGYQVQSQQNLVRLQMPQGRDVYLPVEAYDVRVSRY